MTDRKRHPFVAWLIAWGPALAFMALIFFFSAQPKNTPTDGDAVYFSGVMPVFTVGAWDLVIKKTTHVIGYAILTVLLMRALGYENDRAPRTVAYGALALAVAYGCTDELHQMFVPGRGPSLIDIGFDYIGAALAALIGRRVLAA